MSLLNENLLDEKLAQLEAANNWSPRIISKLEAFIRGGDDYDLFRTDPVQYAAEKGMAENESIDLFLHAAKLGLFDLEWNLICACCGQVFSSLRNIGNLHTHFVCDICRMDNHVQLDDMIQVSFTVSPSIRQILFHNIDQLSADDYAFRFRMAKGVKRQPNLGLNADFMRQCTHTLTYLDAGKTLEADVDASPGLIYGGDLLHCGVFAFLATPSEDGSEPPPVHVTLGMPEMQVTEPQMNPEIVTLITTHGEAKFDYSQFAQVPAGRSHWTIDNQLNTRACIWIFDAPENITDSWIEMPPFLSGKRLLTSQTFRNLYRSEVIDTNEGLGIRENTFLFTDLKGSTALYDQLGDLKAYHLVRQHFDALNNVIVEHSGAVVKTIGDAVMATFCTPLDGMRAALEIFSAIEEFNHGRNEELILKIGLHTGHSIAVTLNESLDYFGQTVNIASRVQQLAQANEIYISQDVYNGKGIQEVLATCNILPVQANVKGVSGVLQLYKITLPEQVVSAGR